MFKINLHSHRLWYEILQRLHLLKKRIEFRIGICQVIVHRLGKEHCKYLGRDLETHLEVLKLENMAWENMFRGNTKKKSKKNLVEFSDQHGSLCNKHSVLSDVVRKKKQEQLLREATH